MKYRATLKLDIRFSALHLCLTILVLYLLEGNLAAARDERFSSCGGHLTARRGLITTPQFPKVFNVPIRCYWIIDSHEVLTTGKNGSIVVYLTQVFINRGIRFTEYAYYQSKSANFGGELLHEVTEANVLVTKVLRTFRPFLVVEFELDRIEGNHIRVLDKLLDVYGFNMTYEMTDQEPIAKSCSVDDCSYAGNCLLSFDNTTFYCDCFEGFGGQHCGYGPLCVAEPGNPICQNGGTCRHIGAAAVRCLCIADFQGEFCEIPKRIEEVTGCAANCTFQCPYHRQDDKAPCKCKQTTNELVKFECQIKLVNSSHQKGYSYAARNVSFESHLNKQFSKYFSDLKIASMEYFKFVNVTPSLEVNFHFYGNPKESGKIRDTLNRVIQSRHIREFFIDPSTLRFQQKPVVRLQSLKINQQRDGVVRASVQIGDKFILSCEALGSNEIQFFWYKDDVAVNASKAKREMWYRHLPNDGSDYQTSILTIDKAVILDSGRYTCQVIDWNIQQCKTIYLDVKNYPIVKVSPMSITVEKGSQVSLICTTPNLRNIGIGFGWTKNRELLRLEPGKEVWEDLYPAGSILKISSAQTSSAYTCSVGQSSSSVRVDVVNKTLIPVCKEDQSWGLLWKYTSPGTTALHECPHGFNGQRVSRQCTFRSKGFSDWELPDFSKCFYAGFASAYNDFYRLTLGYESTNGSSTIQALWDAFNNRHSRLYPGEGDRLISILQEIQDYQLRFIKEDISRNPIDSLLRIIDKTLSNNNSIISMEKLVAVNELVKSNLENWSRSKSIKRHLSLPGITVDVIPVDPINGVVSSSVDSINGIVSTLQIPLDNQKKYPKWYNGKMKLHIRQNQKVANPNSAIVVFYKNYSNFFEGEYSKELESGNVIEYRINSRVMSISMAYPIVDSTTNNKDRNDDDREELLFIELEFVNFSQNYSRGSDNISCGALDSSGDWNLQNCKVLPSYLTDNTVHCRCKNFGTFATFIVSRAGKPSNFHYDEGDVVVLMGCLICLVQSLLSIVVLAAFWIRNPTWLNFLKIQCCSGLVAFMATFMYSLHIAVHESYWSVITMSLEAFLLISLGSPIAMVLIIYSELSSVYANQQLQSAIVAVFDGVPVLIILMIEIIRKTIGWRHESWWLIIESGLFNTFAICAGLLLIVYIILYIAILQKTNLLFYKFKKSDTVRIRIHTLHHSSYVVFGVFAMGASSILYINYDLVIYRYIFAFLSSLLGFIVLLVYVTSGDVLSYGPILHKLKHQRGSPKVRFTEPNVGCTSNREIEKDAASSSISEVYPDVRGVAVGVDVRELASETILGKIHLPVCAGTMTTLIPPNHGYSPEIQVHRVDDIYLDSYGTPIINKCHNRTSPTNLHDSSFSTPLPPPPPPPTSLPPSEIGDSCDYQHIQPPQQFARTREPVVKFTIPVQLSPQHRTINATLCNAPLETCLSTVGGLPDVTLAIIGGEEQILLANPSEQLKATSETGAPVTSVKKMPDIANTLERQRPDGQATAVNGILERISHDFTYLIKRTTDSILVIS